MSARATGFLALREKPDGIHDLLLLTAAYLLSYGDRILAPLAQLEVAVGLPLAYYKAQRDELKKRLEGGRELCLQLNRVAVLPQGAGALMAAGDLPESGLVALLDIGSYTTDYLVFDMHNGQPVPVSECCGSIEAGVSLVSSALADEFQRKENAPLPARMHETILAKARAGEPIIYQGQQVDLSKALATARAQVGSLIASSVAAALRDRVGFVLRTFLAGGGALMFEEEITRVLPCAQVVDDPVYANARGFLIM
jgi:plasmid segregation protein ParM